MTDQPDNPQQIIEKKTNHHRKRNLIFIILGVIFLIGGILWFLYYLFVGRFYVSTTDAYVHGNEVLLTPLVPGNVVAIYADDTDLVEEGQLVVALDPTNYRIALEENTQRLAFIVRQISAAFLDVKEQKARIDLQEAELLLARLELFHREGLVGTHAISLEDYETAQKQVAVTTAQLEVAKQLYEKSLALVQGTQVATHPQVQLQAASVREAYINLLRCNLFSPVTGYIAKRKVQVGEQVQVGEPLLMIVPLYDLWAEANFKETQLGAVRIGQPVTFTTDIYGRHVTYYGTVVGFSPGTGDAFALLPPQNASGNWIKIIQRLPVRISIDPQALRENPLMIGLSLHLSVDIQDTSGCKLFPQPVSGYSRYKTDIFNWEAAFKEVNEMVNFIIEENSMILINHAL